MKMKNVNEFVVFTRFHSFVHSTVCVFRLDLYVSQCKGRSCSKNADFWTERKIRFGEKKPNDSLNHKCKRKTNSVIKIFVYSAKSRKIRFPNERYARHEATGARWVNMQCIQTQAKAQAPMNLWSVFLYRSSFFTLSVSFRLKSLSLLFCASVNIIVSKAGILLLMWSCIQFSLYHQTNNFGPVYCSLDAVVSFIAVWKHH